MADGSAAPSQNGPVAVPVPERPPLLPGHGHPVTETDFWGDEAAPAIGGRFGIPNGMMAAAAGAPTPPGAPGAPDDVGSLLSRLDSRRARGLALQLQRSMGNGNFRSVLAARAAAMGSPAPVIQREPPAATVAAPAGSTGKRLLGPDEQEKLEKDQREFTTLGNTRGSADIWLENPDMVSRGLKEKRIESFTVQSMLARSTEPDERRSWDTEG